MLDGDTTEREGKEGDRHQESREGNILNERKTRERRRFKGQFSNGESKVPF